MLQHVRRLSFFSLMIGALALPLGVRAEEPLAADIAAPELALPSLAAPAPAGRIVGTVLDATSAETVAGVEVTLIRSAAEGGASESDTVVTNADGKYEFAEVPEGTHALRFAKPGYQSARWEEFAVVASQPNPGDFALAPEAPGGVPSGVEEIVVIGQMKAPEVSREISDEFINTMDMSEIGKFAASDIGDAIKRIAGINVVEGQFAIIRGLEDRYSSTLYNSAPVPSPDPDSQSVQLDLFPAEVASNLVVAKTFAPELPSNSAGGSINIISHEYPEGLELKLSGGSGYNTNAKDRFVGYRDGSPIGSNDEDGVTEGEFSASLGGTTLLAERQLRFKAATTWELDYTTRTGSREVSEPRAAQIRRFPAPATVVSSGDLSLGELNLTGGRFDSTESDRVEQLTSFLDVGFDLDTDARHRVDFSAFYTQRNEEAAQLREDGFLPGYDYDALAAKQAAGLQIDPNADFTGSATLASWIARSVRSDTEGGGAENGPAWFANFAEGRSFERKRELLLFQLNGEHDFAALEGLRVSWAGNHAQSRQDDEFFAARFFYEPADLATPPAAFPATVDALGGGEFAANDEIFFNTNEVEETQNFARVDAEYERDLTGWLALSGSTGFWFERAEREVSAEFLESPTVGGVDSFALFGESPQQLGSAVAPSLDERSSGGFSGLRTSTGSAEREVIAWNLRLKATLWENLDLLAGVRREQIEISSENDPFTGETAFDGSPAIYPTKYLMFDRLDNPARAEVAAPVPVGTTFNDQILGIGVPVDPATGFVDLVDAAAIEEFANGRIDENYWLPSAGLSYRLIEGLTGRLAYSQTVARPSFREIGYYVSVEPGTDDLVVGNPQLQLSDVESWDVRLEYVWGDFGDLAALSAFAKDIERPIESIVLRDPTNAEGSSSALYRTFFNNENEASLWGIEAELRKAIDFLGVDLLQYFSLGTNFTWIDAEVDRSAIELQRAAGFFGVAAGDDEQYSSLSTSRRLFSQPEWIVNADLSFDHPEWGTKLTLALFAISDVLDAAGSTTIAPNGSVISLTLDRYVDAFHQLDLIASQSISLERFPGEITVKASLKNLTDSTRRLIYDPSQTAGTIAERSFKVGRDLSVSVSYERPF